MFFIGSRVHDDGMLSLLVPGIPSPCTRLIMVEVFQTSAQVAKTGSV